MERKKLPKSVQKELEKLAHIECREKRLNPTPLRIAKLVSEYGEDYYDSEVPNPAKIKSGSYAMDMVKKRGVFSPLKVTGTIIHKPKKIGELSETEFQKISEALREMKQNPKSQGFKPNIEMIKNARLGLKYRREFGRGGTEIGIARARDIINQKNLSLNTVNRMISFFARHEANKDSILPNGQPGNGRIAWLLWGGDAGFKWAKNIKARHEF